MTDLTNGAPEAADDLHADLAAAFDTPADTGTQDAPVSTPEAPQEPSEGRVRDEQGRFAPKPEDAAAKPQDAPVAPQGQQQAPVLTPPADAAALRPPPGWSIAAKAAFAALPKEVQEAVAAREKEVDQGFAKLTGYKDLDRIIEPHLGKFTMAGVTPAQAIKQLFDAQAVLDRDPVNGIAWLARSYGVDLRQFAPQQPGNGQQPGHQPNPLAQYLDPLRQEILALKGHITTQQQQAVEYQRSTIETEIQAFAADPKHVYFPNVMTDMAIRVESGAAKDLQDAYDQACWANPEIRAALINEQIAANQAETQRKAAEVAANARRAGGSLAGAPVAGSESLGAAPPDSIEAALAQAWTEHGGRL